MPQEPLAKPMSCLFCRIARRELPSAMVAESHTAFAFLDINPVRIGHTLVVPKAHAARVEDMDAASAAGVLQLAQAILPVLSRETGAPDATLAFHNGPAAGQEVPHVHLHVIPRQAGDGGGPVHALFPRPPRPSSDDLGDLALRLQVALEAQ